jgi:hypothetical protein
MKESLLAGAGEGALAGVVGAGRERAARGRSRRREVVRPAPGWLDGTGKEPTRMIPESHKR